MIGEIVNIGTELLMGDTLNTHAQFLSKEMNQYGISVYYHTTVGDNPDRMKEVILRALDRSDVIFCTAGLGPTKDDLTKEIVAEALGLELKLDNKILEDIKSFFKHIDKPMTENNIKQALVPDAGIVLENNKGTAPGLIIPFNDKHIILLPGPKSEFEHVYENGVKNYLKNISKEIIYSEHFYIKDLGESYVESMLSDIIDNQTNPTIATYAKTKLVEIRITAKAIDKNEAIKLIMPIKTMLMEMFKGHIYNEQNSECKIDSLINLLKNNDFRVGTVESCTGGLLSSVITSYSGVSSFYLLGLITYSAEMKIKMLNIEKSIIDKHSVVSEEVSKAMANNLAKINDLDVTISTTGLAGPTNDGLNLPIGTVYISYYIKDKIYTFKKRFKGSRVEIQKQVVDFCLINLFDILIDLGYH